MKLVDFCGGTEKRFAFLRQKKSIFFVLREKEREVLSFETAKDKFSAKKRERFSEYEKRESQKFCFFSLIFIDIMIFFRYNTYWGKIFGRKVIR